MTKGKAMTASAAMAATGIGIVTLLMTQQTDRQRAVRPPAPIVVRQIEMTRKPAHWHVEQVCTQWFRDPAMMNPVTEKPGCVVTDASEKVKVISLAPDLRSGGWFRMTIDKKSGDVWVSEETIERSANERDIEVAP